MTIIADASASIESCRPHTNDERRAMWASKYFLHAFHREPQKPRIRLPVTVPADRVVKDCPQPDGREIKPGSLVYIQQPKREPDRADADSPGVDPQPRAAGMSGSGDPFSTLPGDPGEEFPA